MPPIFLREYPGILVDGQVSPHIKSRTRPTRSAVCASLSRMLHRADVQRATAAAAMQHARASQGERPYRQEAAYTSTTRKNPRNDYLRIENIYCGSRKQRERERKKGREREGKRERGEKRRIVVCQIRNHETKNERREENKELWEAKPSI